MSAHEDGHGKQDAGMVVAVPVWIAVGMRAIGDLETNMNIALVGDSTVTDEYGWGKVFSEKVKTGVNALNFAVCGRSSKSWYEEGRLPAVIKAAPVYVLIQFGHNDQPGKGPERETDPATSYRDYLKLYVHEFRDIGAKPILVSSVTRRTFNAGGKIESTLTPWAEATRAVAKELSAPFIDLHTASVNYHNQIGREASMTFNPTTEDTTHFNRKGANAMAALIIQLIKSGGMDIAECFE